MTDQKVAIVTGGSSGIGRATAEALANEGVNIVVAARRSNEGEETVRLVRQIGSDSIFVKTNVANEDDVRLLIEKTVQLEISDLEGIPPFNQDIEQNMPDKVKEFKTKIREADGILIATPEYNFSVPGVLKNAIDWASRPYVDNPFDGKPVAIMSASPGMLGGANAQLHLRQTCVFLNMYPINKPLVIVTFAQDKFDANG
jgi:NAD(P)H-dependent FMN reductase